MPESEYCIIIYNYTIYLPFGQESLVRIIVNFRCHYALNAVMHIFIGHR